MTIGGLFAGVIVAVAAGLVSRFTALKEDASLAAFYLLSLALGVTIVSLRGSNVDLLHVLFGTVLALDDNTLLLLASISTITVLALAVLYRPLVLECVDPIFLRSVSRAGTPTHLIFLGLVVLNLVGGFHALGTLLAVGMMMLPAAASRFWTSDITMMMIVSVAHRHRVGLERPAALLPCGTARGTGDHPLGRGRLCASRSCSAARAACCGSHGPASIWKPDLP